MGVGESITAEEGERLSLARGEILFRQGDPVDRVYVVERGHVEVYRELPEGREEARARFGPGEHFGERAALENARRRVSARALETAVLVAYAPQDFRVLRRDLGA